tara:strand:+ start:1430 stop:1738 length:309 start_codon:yes stop_codon:yes gene_type:complete
MYKKIIFIILLFIFISSCADSLDSVKRGLTGAKKSTADEFLVQKKDPLILPPDYENLPTPGDRSIALEQDSIFENTLDLDSEEDSSDSKSLESSILKKIQSK